MFSAADIALVLERVHDAAGIVIELEKRPQIEDRLRRLAQSRGRTTRQVMAGLRCRDPQTCADVVELFCNHETYFFRDPRVYDLLRFDILPALLQARAAERQLRIWSAVCASGQETWSLAMLLEEMQDFAGWDVQIFGTDISEPALRKAASGQYSLMEVNRGLPVLQLTRHFHRNELLFEVNPQLRRRVRFLPLNLIGDWPQLPVFDIVLLRNVLIYFDTDTQRQVLERAVRVMRRDGYLILGGCESALGLVEGLNPGPGERFDYYRLRPRGQA